MRRGVPARTGAPAAWLPAVACLALLTAAVRPAEAVGRIDRPGVYAIGAWAQYGLVEGNSRYGLDFSKGSGYSIHFRYNTSRKLALALYFDNQSWDARGDSLVDARITAVHGGIRLFSIPNGDVLRYFELTAGFYRPEIRFPNTILTSIGEDICFPGEGFLAHAGAGIEIFFTSAWALELGGHGYLLTGKGLCPTEAFNGEKDLSVSGQAAVGLTYYLLREDGSGPNAPRRARPGPCRPRPDRGTRATRSAETVDRGGHHERTTHLQDR